MKVISIETLEKESNEVDEICQKLLSSGWEIYSAIDSPPIPNVRKKLLTSLLFKWTKDEDTDIPKEIIHDVVFNYKDSVSK